MTRGRGWPGLADGLGTSNVLECSNCPEVLGGQGFIYGRLGTSMSYMVVVECRENMYVKKNITQDTSAHTPKRQDMNTGTLPAGSGEDGPCISPHGVRLSLFDNSSPLLCTQYITIIQALQYDK